MIGTLTLFAAQTKNKTENTIPDKPYNSSADGGVDVGDAATAAARNNATVIASFDASCRHKSATQATEEYKDSLEFSAVNKRSITMKNDDAIEQDSLEPSKIEATTVKGAGSVGVGVGSGATQFLPFAHIGTKWSNERTAQINTIDTITNQIVEIKQTNEIAGQSTNTSLTENEFDILPGDLQFITNTIHVRLCVPFSFCIIISSRDKVFRI